MRTLFLFLFIILISTNLSAQGKIINVPDDQATIQAAINASVDGDTVLVADGTYYENIDFAGKAITVSSWFLTDGNQSHIDNTIIDGSQSSDPDSGSVVYFHSQEDTTSVLYGFTITGGSGTYNSSENAYGGGGIAVDGAGGKIQYNKITNNTLSYNNLAAGGGIIIAYSVNPVVVENNSITNNTLVSQTGAGGGILCYYSSSELILIAGNVISDNLITNGEGGGIYLRNSSAEIRNNLIKNNSSYGIMIFNWVDPGSYNMIFMNNTVVYNEDAGFAYSSERSSPEITNSIYWGNNISAKEQIGGAGTVFVKYSNVEGGFDGAGNIDFDPLFADTVNYYLTSSSPCVDAGVAHAFYNDLEDPDNPGSPLFPALGGLRNDMGAYGGNPGVLNIPQLEGYVNVPADNLTIQGAINFSSDGDTVLVAEGTYYENISFKGKAVTVASWFLVDGDESHIENTIIDGSQHSDPDSGTVVLFHSGEDTTSVLYGLTITGGKGQPPPPNIGGTVRGGGGIGIGNSGAKIAFNRITNNHVEDANDAVGAGIVISTPTNPIKIVDNYITDNRLITNSSNGYGGSGIFCYLASNHLIEIANNVIAYNEVKTTTGALTGYGGGIDLEHSNAVIRNNLIKKNKAGEGAGINIYDYPGSDYPAVINNTIVYNEASVKGGGFSRSTANGSVPEIVNSILWGNSAPLNNQINNQALVTYSNVESGYSSGNGNIDQDPLFADTVNYYLSEASPCIDAGQPDAICNDVEDPGNPGSPLFPAMGGLRNDMGYCGGNPNMIYANTPSHFIKNCVLNDTYQVPGMGTLTISSDINCPGNQSVTVQAIIENYDKSLLETVSLSDDGNSCFSGSWSVPDVEDDYKIHLSAYYPNYDHEALVENAAYFTTKGPLVFENMAVTSGNENPIPTERFKFSITLKNESITDTVYDVGVNILKPNYPYIVISTLGVPKFDDIAPGESQTSFSRDFAINFYVGCSAGEYEFGVEITSHDVPYWYDTLTITVDEPTDVEDEQTDLPTEFALAQNYPNPFNPATTIKYSIPEAVNSEWSIVNLTIYDMLGKEVATLVNEHQRPGSYSVAFDASSLSSGIYFYRLHAGNFIKTNKMLLLR